MGDPLTETTRRFRSPSYPAIDLSRAIERARQLHAKALHHPAAISVAADAWSYSAKSSGATQVISALLQFDLATDEGSGESRRIRLTDRALRIIKDPDPKSQKRLEAIRGAALAPRIHKELWGRFQTADGLADTLLQTYLTLERSENGNSAFSDSAATDLIKEYRATLVFASLEEIAPKSEANGEAGPADANGHAVDGNIELEEMSDAQQPAPTPVKAGQRQDIFDLPEGKVILTWPDRLSESSLNDIEDWFALVLRKAKRSAVPGE